MGRVAKELELIKTYIHVDNGGYSFGVYVTEYDGYINSRIEISDGYYGYSETTLSLNEKVTPETLRQIATAFNAAANKLDKIKEGLENK